MIDSWKKFVLAVDQMRQLQMKPDIKKQGDLYVRLKRTEAEVDEACNKKIAEWNAKGDLFKSTGVAG
jgi:hypothetical protein